MRFVRSQLIRMVLQCSRRMAFFPVRNSTTHTQEIAWLITVASAAPSTPISSVKMKMGSSTMLITAPMRVVSIPVRGKPWALM